MQFGQVPIMFTPEAAVNDTRAVTLPAEDQEVVAPTLRPGEAPPVVEIKALPPAPAPWLTVAGLVAALWFLTRRRRRR